jgi:lipopolysaccharide/colanic/teichoic acid biosynthesis glycosyltransferase
MKQAGLPLLVKKTFDRVAGAALLVAASPVIGVAAACVKATMGGPVFYSQLRPGYHGQPFRMFKMRSMTDERGPDGQLKPDMERLTPLGRFLRSTSIDELPQLWNVVRGDLSLVGPRPLLMSYLPRYSAEQARRHDVLPGITGWAQVRGRNARTWGIKLDYDIWYVDHWSLGLDLRILAETAYRVLRREGISHPGHVTMPEFIGSTNGATA